ncbi:hypothetical protein DL95DRAFT_470355 [Leptodontidium sp. 2 PMI_412]|nr:hypothetical protein DL95DRAFT_470355 [Leptodontidium sp. 2 PMI_412]
MASLLFNIPEAMRNRYQGVPPAANSPDSVNSGAPLASPRAGNGGRDPPLARNSTSFNRLGARTGGRSGHGPGPHMDPSIIESITANNIGLNPLPPPASSQLSSAPVTTSSENTSAVDIRGLGRIPQSLLQQEQAVAGQTINNQNVAAVGPDNGSLGQGSGSASSESTMNPDISTVPVAPTSGPPPRPIKPMKVRVRPGAAMATIPSQPSTPGNQPPTTTTPMNLGTVAALLDSAHSQVSVQPHRAILPSKKWDGPGISNLQIDIQHPGPSTLGETGLVSNNGPAVTHPTTPPRSRQEDTMDTFGIPAEAVQPFSPDHTPLVIPDTPPRVISGQIPGSAMSSDQAKQSAFLSGIARKNAQDHIAGPFTPSLTFANHQTKHHDTAKPPLGPVSVAEPSPLFAPINSARSNPAPGQGLFSGQNTFSVQNPLAGPAPRFQSNLWADPPSGNTSNPVQGTSFSSFSAAAWNKPSGTTATFGFGATSTIPKNIFNSPPKAHDAALGKRSLVGKPILAPIPQSGAAFSNFFSNGTFGILGPTVTAPGNVVAVSATSAESIPAADPINISADTCVAAVQPLLNDVEMGGFQDCPLPRWGSPILRPSQPDQNEDAMIDDVEEEADTLPVAVMKAIRAKSGDTTMEEAPPVPVVLSQPRPTSPSAEIGKADQEMHDAPEELVPLFEAVSPAVQLSSTVNTPVSTNKTVQDVPEQVLPSSRADLPVLQSSSAIDVLITSSTPTQDVLQEKVMQPSEAKIPGIQSSSEVSALNTSPTTVSDVVVQAGAVVFEKIAPLTPINNAEMTTDSNATGNVDSTSAVNGVSSSELEHAIFTQEPIVVAREEGGETELCPDLPTAPLAIQESSPPQEPGVFQPYLDAPPPMQAAATEMSTRPASAAPNTVAVSRRRDNRGAAPPSNTRHSFGNANSISLATELEKRCRAAICKTNLYVFKEVFDYIERSAEVINDNKKRVKLDSEAISALMSLSDRYEAEGRRLKAENEVMAREIADLRKEVHDNRIVIIHANNMKPDLDAARKLLRETVDENTKSREKLMNQLIEAQKPLDKLRDDHSKEIEDLNNEFREEREETRLAHVKTGEVKELLKVARETFLRERLDREKQESDWRRTEQEMRRRHERALEDLKTEHLRQIGNLEKRLAYQAEDIKDMKDVQANVENLWSLDFKFDGMREAVIGPDDRLSLFTQPGDRSVPKDRVILQATRKNTESDRRNRNYRKPSRFSAMQSYIKSALRPLSFRQYRTILQAAPVNPSSTVAAVPNRQATVMSAIRAKFVISSRRCLVLFALLAIIIMAGAGIFFLLPHLTPNGQNTPSLPHEQNLDYLRDTCPVIFPTLTALVCGTESPTAVITTHTAVETGFSDTSLNETTSDDAAARPSYIPFEGDDIFEDGPAYIDGIDWSTPIAIGVQVTVLVVPAALVVWVFHVLVPAQ